MFYSFFGTPQKNDENPFYWLNKVLEVTPKYKVSKLDELWPQNLVHSPDLTSPQSLFRGKFIPVWSDGFEIRRKSDSKSGLASNEDHKPLNK